MPFTSAGHMVSENVRLLGPVSDLTPILAQSTIGLAPLSIGSGMKIKILTYLSAGLPVIASTVALRGFLPTPALIAVDDPGDYPAAIREATVNTTHWQGLSRLARSYYEDNFAANKNNSKLLEYYRNIRFDPDPSAYDIPLGKIDLSKLHWLQEVREGGRPPVTGVMRLGGWE